MPDKPLPAEDQLLRLLERMRMLGPALPLPDDTDMPVTPAQLVLRGWIAASPGCRSQEVAAGLGLTPPTVSVGCAGWRKPVCWSDAPICATAVPCGCSSPIAARSCTGGCGNFGGVRRVGCWRA